MLSKFKPVSISLSPNVQKDDIQLVVKLLFQPWKWKKGSAIKELENEFKKYLGVKYAFSFNSGRSSLFAILKSLNLEKNNNILLQAFTCNAVPNPVLWAGLNPIYVDCADDFNIDIKDLDRLIRANKSRVLIVQHTFGLPANMDEVNLIVDGSENSSRSENSLPRQNNLILIEDCAHALGAGFNGKKVGTFGDAAFFSFSRDKVISCVYGGMAVTNDDEIGKKLEALSRYARSGEARQKEFSYPSYGWIFQQLLHPILLNFIILPLYNFLDLGKIFLVLSQWLHLLSKAVNWKEKRGLKPDYFPKVLPNALAILAKHQLNKLEKFNNHRKKIAGFYYKELSNTKFILPEKNNNIFLRFAVRHSKAHEIIYEAWHKENILLGDWYRSPIDPNDTRLEEIKYREGMCKNAEALSKKTLNLPTHINISLQPRSGQAISDAERIVNFLKKYK